LSPKVTIGRAFARAGLLGNPSDGYFGRALSVILRNFQATVTLEESADLRIDAGPHVSEVFEDMGHLAISVSRNGYRGGGRLIQAAIKTFHAHCVVAGCTLSRQNFTARFHSSIPRQVGLAGSSAIVTAAVRGLMSFYDVRIPREVLPNLILSAEVDELGISAGLQDRVVQVYEGLVYMDFSRQLMEELGHGAYESLDPALLPPMFLGYQPASRKVSGSVHGDLMERWRRGDMEVHETLDRIAALALAGRDALLIGDAGSFSSLMNENFDLRRRIMRVQDRDLAMVEAARALGASAKLTGSGGAIIGVLESEGMEARIREKLEAIGARVVVPLFEGVAS
jgi:glucuronokinase